LLFDTSRLLASPSEVSHASLRKALPCDSLAVMADGVRPSLDVLVTMSRAWTVVERARLMT